MTELNRWQTLQCPCGSTEFVQVMELRRQAGGGLTRDPVGERCIKCHKQVDVQAMLRAQTLARRRQELAAMEEEVAVLDAQSSSGSSPVSNASSTS